MPVRFLLFFMHLLQMLKPFFFHAKKGLDSFLLLGCEQVVYDLGGMPFKSSRSVCRKTSFIS